MKNKALLSIAILSLSLHASDSDVSDKAFNDEEGPQLVHLSLTPPPSEKSASPHSICSKDDCAQYYEKAFLNASSESETEDYDYTGDFSPQVLSALEKAYESHDRYLLKRERVQSARHISQQMQAAQPQQHLPRKKGTRRTINPFDVTTPDLLGAQPLGKQRVSAPRAQSNVRTGHIRHSEAKNQAAAATHGHERKSGTQPFLSPSNLNLACIVFVTNK